MARRYGFYLLVVKTMFYSFAIRSFVSLIKVLFSQLEDRIHIFAPPCNILSMYSSIHIVSIKEMNTKERQTDRQTDTDTDSFFHSLSYLILIVGLHRMAIFSHDFVITYNKLYNNMRTTCARFDWSIPIQDRVSHTDMFHHSCRYFIKQIPNGFQCRTTVIQTRGMLRLKTFQKA